MSKNLFIIEKSNGILSFQDLGRNKWQAYGIPVSGAMDHYSISIGNLLVGNKRTEAALEIGIGRIRLKVLTDLVLAITGADLNAKRNNSPMPLWKAQKVYEGDILTFEGTKNGVWTYLSVAGGFEVPIVMGSKSTYVKGQIGQIIQTGDTLRGEGGRLLNNVGLKDVFKPRYARDITLSVVLDCDADAHFTKKSLGIFFSQGYTVKQSDRMGYRLVGEKGIEHLGTADILSEPIPFGGIQIPPDGQPIILMADRQTTGGYTLIGTIITGDLPKIAQAQVGTRVYFKFVSIEEAQEILRKNEGILRIIEQEAIDM